jgi:type I restriction enzyme S subunit
LGEIANLQAGIGFPPKLQGRPSGDYPFAKVGDISRGGRSESTILSTADNYVDDVDVKNLRGKLIPVGSVLFAKIGEAIRQNHRVVVGRSMLIDNNAMAAIPGNNLNSRFLYHFLKTVDFYVLAPATTVPALRKSELEKILVPDFPLDEQRRIAAILDQADALRAKRREALAELDGLAQAIFVEMFGDPIQNPKGWPCALFDSKLSIPLRNGISPSSSGGVQAKVLTLAAITGKSFNSNAWKYGPYQSKPLASLSVNEQDFLICRGNGNKELVGKGCFPSGDTMDTVFPDTIIAAQTDPKKVNRLYLQCHWNSRAVRKQIEAGARTTNGTFKVNQALLEKISLIDPPIDLQNTFGTRIQALDSLKATHRTALTELDALFASLQHRAFRGEL